MVLSLNCLRASQTFLFLVEVSSFYGLSQVEKQSEFAVRLRWFVLLVQMRFYPSKHGRIQVFNSFCLCLLDPNRTKEGQCWWMLLWPNGWRSWFDLIWDLILTHSSTVSSVCCLYSLNGHRFLVSCCSLLRLMPNPGGGRTAKEKLSHPPTLRPGLNARDTSLNFSPANTAKNNLQGNQSHTFGPSYLSKNSNSAQQGRQSPTLSSTYSSATRQSNIDITQSPIRLRLRPQSRKKTSPLCERSASGHCEKQFCSAQNPIGDSSLLSKSQSDSITLVKQRAASPLKSNVTRTSEFRLRTPCKGAAGCCREACCRLPGNENKVCDPLCPFHQEKSVGLVTSNRL